MLTANLIFLYVSAGIGSCLSMILLLYNVVAGVLFLREDTGDERAGGLAKAAWALGLVALLAWPLPCVGSLLAISAMVISRVERGRIYRDESSLAGATPVRMGSVNGGVALMIQFFAMAGLLVGVLTGAGGPAEAVAP